MSNVSDLTGEVAAIGSHMFKVRFLSSANYGIIVEKFRADLIAGSTLTLVSIPKRSGSR